MKQIILPSTKFEFKWFIIDGSMKVNGLAPLHPFPSPKKEIKYPRNLKFSQPLAKRCKKPFSPHKKNICNQNIFFVWDLHSPFLYMEFSSPTWRKSPPSKEPILTKNPHLTYIPPIKTLWKMTQTPPHRRGGVGMGVANYKWYIRITSHLQYFGALQHSHL